MDQPIGHGVEAYRARAAGHSPDAVREVVWADVEGALAGVVLDAGCGSGEWARRLRTHPRVTEVVAVDHVDAGASRVEDVTFAECDLASQALPRPDASMDWVFAIEVLEHLPNPRHFVAEARRVLRPGGRLVVTTPSNESLRARLSFLVRGYFPAFCDHDYRGSGHITPITSLDLQRMGNEAGFAAVDVRFPFEGALPMSGVRWQTLLPRARGKLWSDGLLAILRA